MKLALYHGYELNGSGSNEYTRYLARTLASAGHDVTLICRDPSPEDHEFVSRAVAYTVEGEPTELFRRENDLPAAVTLHQLPATSIYPVFLKDKQREGHVKSFPEMTDDELKEYHDAMVAVVRRALLDDRPEIMHCNHLVYQPRVAMEACHGTGIPFYIVPHGSSIEYTIREDERFRRAAAAALRAADGVVWIAREVRDRVLGMFPELSREIEAKSGMVGVGTDTSLFQPLVPEERASSIDKLKQMHRPGGKTPAQRIALKQALDDGNVESMCRYWEAYDHKLPDDDLPQILDGIPLDRHLLFFVGALTYGKGVQSLIAAMPAILKRHPDTDLVLVGSGTYREALEGLVHAIDSRNLGLLDEIASRGRSLERDAGSGPLEDLQIYLADPRNREVVKRHGAGLARRVHFLGRLDHPMLRRIFPCCRIGVFPSVIKEASPLVFFESMANGVLPTGAYHSGLRDGLDDLRPHLPQTTWERMCLPENSAERVGGIAERIADLLDLDSTPGKRLRQIAVDHYDWTAVAQKLVDTIAAFAPAQTSKVRN